VTHCQAGVDDCNSHSVSRENLIKLKDVCTSVLADNSKANSLLPPQAGFFFGSTEINDWYIDDLKLTIEIIDRCLKERLSTWNFSYQSSW
jgi:hypothetical protein